MRVREGARALEPVDVTPTEGDGRDGRNGRDGRDGGNGRNGRAVDERRTDGVEERVVGGCEEGARVARLVEANLGSRHVIVM